MCCSMIIEPQRSQNDHLHASFCNCKFVVTGCRSEALDKCCRRAIQEEGQAVRGSLLQKQGAQLEEWRVRMFVLN